MEAFLQDASDEPRGARRDLFPFPNNPFGRILLLDDDNLSVRRIWAEVSATGSKYTLVASASLERELFERYVRKLDDLAFCDP